MTYKTTKKDFKLFQKEAEYWIEYFGLKNWEITYFHEKLEPLAQCGTTQNAKSCSLFLSTDWGDNETSNYEVRLSAFHEVCELMISPLADLMHEVWSHGIIESKVHDIIMRLQNTVFKESYK